jgi:hypothetical protein
MTEPARDPSPRGEGDSRVQARAGWGGTTVLNAQHGDSAPPGRALTRPSPPSPRGEGFPPGAVAAYLYGIASC